MILDKYFSETNNTQMKKAILGFLFVSLIILSSCNTVKVTADYDTSLDFTPYKTFAFYKKGIEKVEISDLDKKRIVKAIEQEMLAKGFTLSDKPDIIVNIFAKTTKKVNVHNSYYPYYWQPFYYYGPYWGAGGTYISEYDEGTLFIDFVDNGTKELVWQGIGKGVLSVNNAIEKDEKVKEFVNLIMAQYPPGQEVNKK